MSWAFTTSGAALAKAGANVNPFLAQASAAALITKWADQAERAVNVITRKDWVAASAALTANFQGILDDITSDMIAVKMINYDPSGYTNLEEASLMVDILTDNKKYNLEILKQDENQKLNK